MQIQTCIKAAGGHFEYAAHTSCC